MRQVERLITASWVVPVEPDGVVLSDHAVAIDGSSIVAVLPMEDALRQFVPHEVVQLPRHVLIPGLVNLHTHAAMALMRGLADDLPLMMWLREHIWPAEGRHVSPQFVYDGTLLAAAEMIRGGVTCANDMYYYPESAARAFVDAGMRSSVGLIAIELATRYAADAEGYIEKGLAARDALRDEPLVSFCMAPHAPYTVADRTLERVGMLAEELDLPIHLHLHETHDELEQSVREHGVRPIERLRRLGLLSPRLIAVHAVQLQPTEIDLLAAHGCSVAHCPSSNLKLASGFAPVAAMLEQGVNVGIGTDGAASNNRLDVLGETRAAALLAKAVAHRADAMPAHTALRAATLAGARALGLERCIGSIEIGKEADLCAVSLDRPELMPCYDPVSHLIYCAGREDVTHVWVRGRPAMLERRLIQADPKGLENLAFLWHNAVLQQVVQT